MEKTGNNQTSVRIQHLEGTKAIYEKEILEHVEDFILNVDITTPIKYISDLIYNTLSNDDKEEFKYPNRYIRDVIYNATTIIEFIAKIGQDQLLLNSLKQQLDILKEK